MPSSRGSSACKDQTLISYFSCIGGRFFTANDTLEAPSHIMKVKESERKSLSRVRLFVTPWMVAY